MNALPLADGSFPTILVCKIRTTAIGIRGAGQVYTVFKVLVCEGTETHSWVNI